MSETVVEWVNRQLNVELQTAITNVGAEAQRIVTALADAFNKVSGH